MPAPALTVNEKSQDLLLSYIKAAAVIRDEGDRKSVV